MYLPHFRFRLDFQMVQIRLYFPRHTWIVIRVSFRLSLFRPLRRFVRLHFPSISPILLFLGLPPAIPNHQSSSHFHIHSWYHHDFFLQVRPSLLRILLERDTNHLLFVRSPFQISFFLILVHPSDCFGPDLDRGPEDPDREDLWVVVPNRLHFLSRPE